MRSESPRATRKVGLFVIVALTVVASGAAARAQLAPASRVAFLSCLAIETAASPSAGSLAPVAEGNARAGRVERLRQVVLGASSRTLRPSVGDNLQFADVADAGQVRVGSFDDMRQSLHAQTLHAQTGGSLGAVADHFSKTTSAPAPAFELGFGSQAAGPMPLALDALRDNETPLLRANTPGTPQSQSWTGLNSANSMYGAGGAPQTLNLGLTHVPPPSVTPPLSRSAQPFSSRILIPSSLSGGSTNP